MMEPFNWKAQAEKQWDERASSWNSRSREMWEKGSRKDLVPFMRKFVPLASKVCDLGCGDGLGSEKLAQAGFAVTGVDVSEEMLAKAKQNPYAAGIQFIKADLANCGSANHSFDALMSINALEWTDSPYDSLQEMARILKPRGYACIGILGPTAAPRANSYRRLYGDKVICNTIMPWELEKLATENGWKKIGEYGVFKQGASQLALGTLTLELQQALSFMWVFMFQLNS
jgi:ubiquinone/menaquinone biosynthesis C-methylase UbiE